MSLATVSTQEDLVRLRKDLRAQGKKLVFTNGCFDILHHGHVRYLEAARALGDALVVGINSDASVSRLKGPTRPVVKEEERAFIIGSLRCVDYVFVFTEDTPREAIVAIEPDVLVKGGDYAGTEIVGADVVRGYGGDVAIVQLVPNSSSTRIIERMNEKRG